MSVDNYEYLLKEGFLEKKKKRNKKEKKTKNFYHLIQLIKKLKIQKYLITF